MPRLSAMDRAFFLLETEQRPMNVGVLVVVAPPPTRRGRPSDALVRAMLRCPVGPPFDTRLAPGPWPTLVPARVDPAEQLYRHRLPADSDLPALFARVCALHAQRLDRAHPLWEMHVFDGLARGRVALYFKTHHGLIDGLGFLQVIRRTVHTRPGGKTPQAIWQGVSDTSSGPPAAPAASSPWSWGTAVRVGRTASDLLRLCWRLGRRDLGFGSGLAPPFISTPNVLKARPSPNRVMAHCVLPLARARSVARHAGVKVNDVLLATIDLALNRYLDRRGVRTERPLVADMPVALHDAPGAGNRVTILQVPMGRPGGTPAERLADIARETRLVKQEVRANSADALFWYSIVEHALASAIETFDLGELPMLANAVISNPAGLDGKVWFNGLPVELALPVSVVAHHQVLNVTVTHCGPTLDVTFMALREAVPDVQALAADTPAALLDLQRSVTGPQRRPARTRRLPRPPRRAAPAHETLH